MSDGLQAQYRQKYEETAKDSIWDLVEDTYEQQEQQDGNFMPEESSQEDMQGRTASASIESESMSVGVTTSNTTSDSSSYYSGSTRTYTSSTQSGKDTVHSNVKPVRKQVEKPQATAQPEPGPYTNMQLNKYVELVNNCLDPTFVPCDTVIMGIAEQR